MLTTGNYAGTRGTYLYERGALRGLWVPHRRQEVLPPVDPQSVIAGPRRGVYQYLPREARVGATPEYSGTRRYRLERRRCGALEVSAAVGVRHGSGEKRRQVDHHAVGADLPARRRQRRGLGAVRRLVEGPGAESRALRRRVADPEVGGAAGEPAVGPAASRAESVDCDVGGCEDDGDVSSGGDDAAGEGVVGEGEEGGGGEGAAEGVIGEEDLRAEKEGGGGGGGGGVGVVPPDGGPPGGDGRGGRRRGRRMGQGEGKEEVGYGSAVGGGEAAVPKEVEGDVAGEKAAVMVLEHDGGSGDKGGVCQRKKEEEERSGGSGGHCGRQW
ncbi:hypothetical protein AXF42_Ash017648 [Apostasia shenzhenica]|uniref:Uncharacterized protein n=1 Tax=Apostasia shenzhenica TaxID=1088818 RepID=A0A2I0A5E5_9ASPA|nr:hypothetical protein AXF42_Ash017648 [Apostasia shenzhenica]